MFFFETDYVAFSLNPLPWTSAEFKSFLLIIFFKMLVVGWRTCRFFIFSALARPIIGAGVSTAGLREDSYAFWQPFKVLLIVFSNPSPSSWKRFGVKKVCLWPLHLRLGHMSCNLSRLPLLCTPHLEILHFEINDCFCISNVCKIFQVWSVWF